MPRAVIQAGGVPERVRLEEEWEELVAEVRRQVLGEVRWKALPSECLKFTTTYPLDEPNVVPERAVAEALVLLGEGRGLVDPVYHVIQEVEEGGGGLGSAQCIAS